MATDTLMQTMDEEMAAVCPFTDTSDFGDVVRDIFDELGNQAAFQDILLLRQFPVTVVTVQTNHEVQERAYEMVIVYGPLSEQHHRIVVDVVND